MEGGRGVSAAWLPCLGNWNWNEKDFGTGLGVR
jgi:hypothetical protein